MKSYNTVASLFINNKVLPNSLVNVVNKSVKPRHICVRHGSERKDSRLTSFFLCDECFRKLYNTAFNKYKPAYIMPQNGYIEGYCLYCGRRTKVRQYFYFLCEICERIIHSYGKELAARNFVLSLWDTVRKEYGINIVLKVEDPVIPMNYKQHREFKKKSYPKPDFVALENEKPVFAIEMKTGRSSISDMSSFQLDISDCNDILGFLKRPEYRIPTFLFHVQVLEEYNPPTMRYVGVNAWWASLYDLEKNIIEVKMRARERRPAVYYRKEVFKPIDTLPQYIINGGLKREQELINKRLPRLYPQEEV